MESNLIRINKNFSKFHHKIFQKKKDHISLQRYKILLS